MRIADRAAGRDNNFSLVRMIAATAVLVSHAYPLALGSVAIEPLESLLHRDHIKDNLGRAAVFAFFCISGFFITRSFCQRRTLGGFVRARVLRLFPALVPMSVIVFVLVALWGTTAPGVDVLRAFPGYFYRIMTLGLPDMFGLTHVAGALPGAFAENPLPGAINGSLWTLPFEVLCYVLVVITGLLGLLRSRLAFMAAFALLLAAYLFVFLVVPGKDSRLDLMLYLALPFGIGAAFWVWRDTVMLSLWLTLVLAVIAWVARDTVLFRPLFCLALAHGLFVIGYARIPIIGQYNRLGDYSYGMYIYAFPIQQMAAAHGATTPTINLLISLPITLVLAVISWHLVEKPAMRFGRRRPDTNVPSSAIG